MLKGCLWWMCVLVVGKEEVWHCWISFHCLKSTFTCLWSSVLNDLDIFDKVWSLWLPLQSCLQLSLMPIWVQERRVHFVSCIYLLINFCLVQHTQGILSSSRNFISHFRPHTEVASGGAWPPSNTPREPVWSTSFWWGEISKTCTFVPWWYRR